MQETGQRIYMRIYIIITELIENSCNLQNFIPEPQLAMPSKQYDHRVAMNGMEVAIGKIMAGKTACTWDSMQSRSSSFTTRTLLQ